MFGMKPKDQIGVFSGMQNFSLIFILYLVSSGAYAK